MMHSIAITSLHLILDDNKSHKDYDYQHLYNEQKYHLNS